MEDQIISLQEYREKVLARLKKNKDAHLSEDERILYNRDLKWARDYNAEMSYVRNESEARGEAKGIVKGRAEGRAEEKRLTAKNLKALGVDVATIAKATGLTEEEICNL